MSTLKPTTLNLKDRIFGRLKVLEFVEYRQRGRQRYAVWKCECECGSVIEVFAFDLLRKKTKTGNTKRSCGCLFNEVMNKQNSTSHWYGGSNLNLIRSNTIRSDNKSGVRGVRQDKERGKYIAYITFKKKRHYLGRYDTIDLAREARELAEKEIWGELIKKGE